MWNFYDVKNKCKIEKEIEYKTSYLRKCGKGYTYAFHTTTDDGRHILTFTTKENWIKSDAPVHE